MPTSTHIRETQINTTCAYCGVGCGLTVNKQSKYCVKADNTLVEAQHTLPSLAGDVNHPANSGKLCVKGSHLLDTNSLEGRLLAPTIKGEQATWQEAIGYVVNAIKSVVNEHGPQAIAFYLSGQLLTEDYYVANKLMKGFIGSANVDTNSRLCMSSAVAAYKRAFGADAVPCCYEDLSNSDLIVLIGSNAAWTHPVLYQQMQAAKAARPNMKMVLIDPRVTATNSDCDLHLAIKAGSDAWLFNGLLNFLHANQLLDVDFIRRHTEHFEACIAKASSATIEHVAQMCEVDEKSLKTFYQFFADASRAISFYSMGINQSSSGVDKANSIINCHLASGKIGKVGSGPFSITGQPNAMGGREVGGLANMLAAHMDIENETHRDIVERFWQAPRLVTQSGLKAVDMFEAMEQGKIKFIWIMGTNPVVSMPNRGAIERALRKCEHVVVSEVVDKNDTLPFAHVALPATPWSEKNGTVTNSERCISRQRALLPPAGQAKHDWQAICEVAKHLGLAQAFNFKHPSEIFSEHAKLSGFENNGSRAFNIAGLSDLDERAYDALQPIQWPVFDKHSSGTQRLFTDAKFFTASGKAQFVAIQPRQPEQPCSKAYPYVLNSGRMRDQWHTMTRTGKAAKLLQHTQQAYVYMHPLDAKTLGVQHGDFIALRSKQSHQSPCILPVSIDNKQPIGAFFCPIHWSKSNSSHVKIAALFSSAKDPLSGQPELKHAAVSAKAVHMRASMRIYTSEKLDESRLHALADYFVWMRLDTGFVYQLALLPDELKEKTTSEHCFASAADWTHFVHKHILACRDLAQDANNPITAELESFGASLLLPPASDSTLSYQHICLQSKRLILFSTCHFKENGAGRSDAGELPTSSANLDNWLAHLLSLDAMTEQDTHLLLRNQIEARFAQGRQICSCFKVHEKPIISAIKQGDDSVYALGKRLNCGSNCGSCKSELKSLIDEHKQHSSAETLQIALHQQTNTSIDIKVEI
ncbi:molybdopterin-dependent oxidoreductase [Glaciecola siphonariae]|uniref:Molybdopterin-dependent oxidoreductase n=1 Tax=Glaciecola siphonariae TaxID=521012 RepID=A0ABV9LW96_9ALTE